MTHDLALPSPRSDRLFACPLHLVCFGLCVAHLVFLAAAFVQGTWLIQGDGHGVPTDFVNVWAAGRLALDGQPAAAYNWPIHKHIENAAVGYPFEGYYGWHYPPPFLFIAMGLAMLPYVVGYVGWLLATFPIYVVTIRWIVEDRVGYLLAGAFPAVLANMTVGQNGFLTASLIGGTLGFMEKRPIVAGCCLGLLTYKPHFGILFPLVVLVAGYWTVFWSAAVVGIVLAGLSWLAFGTEAWAAFIHWLPVASQAFLSDGQADWSKLQSVFGLTRILGGSERLAWVLQGGLTACAAIVLCILWRRRGPFEMKAALLATSVLLATPYVYLYDMVVLAVPVAFLVRVALRSGWRGGEMIGLGLAAALVFAFPFVKAPVGLAATFLVGGLIVRRLIGPQPAPAVSAAVP